MNKVKVRNFSVITHVSDEMPILSVTINQKIRRVLNFTVQFNKVGFM